MIDYDIFIWSQQKRRVRSMIESDKIRFLQKASQKSKQKFLPRPKDIPWKLDPFYDKMGHFYHPMTDEEVLKLTPYQHWVWDDMRTKNVKYRLYLKSQKIGLTMLFLMEDFFHALTDCMGKEILLVAQTKEKAREHMQDLQRMIRGSAYSGFLIDESKNKDNILADEITKVDTIYLENTKNPKLPTKIIAHGFTSPGALISYKRVGHIHASDITLAEMSEERADQAFAGLKARLANRDGQMVIEVPPRGTTGPIWRICNSPEVRRRDGYLLDLDENPTVTKDRYLIRRLTYELGVKYGIITQKFIDGVKRDPMFDMYYNGTFYSGDKTWFSPKHAGQTGQEETDFANEIMGDFE